LQHVRSHRRREDIRRDEGGGQPLAGLEVSQRLFVTAKSEVEQAARIVEAYPGGGIWTSLILLWISRSMPDRTCNRSCGMPVRCHQGGSAMAADRHATARTSLAATEAIRAARPTTGKPPPRQSSGRLHVKFSRAGREIGRAAAGHGERAGDPGRKASR
jgi:hypothetical protein